MVTKGYYNSQQKQPLTGFFSFVIGVVEQQWYGNRWAAGVSRNSLATGAAGYAQACLNSTGAMPGEVVTTYICDGTDKLQDFQKVKILGYDKDLYPQNQYLLKLGTGNINQSLCLEPLSQGGTFIANMNLTYQRCNAGNRNQWFEFQNWR